MLFFCVIALFIAVPSMGNAATYYLAASGGSNNNPCSESQPCSSFSTALPLLQPGDSLILKSGVYTQNLKIGSPPVTSGRSDAWITVKGESRNTVTLKPSGIEGMTVNGNTQYWQLEHVTIDCSGLSNTDSGANCISVNWRPGPQESPEATSHIALRHITITKTANPTGDHSTGIQAFANDITIDDISIDGTSIQHGDYQGSHCLYINGNRQIVKNVKLSNCGGYGIQRNDTDSSWTQGNRGNAILHAIIEDSGRRSSGGRGCLTNYHNQQGTLIMGVVCNNSRSMGILDEGNGNTGTILVHNTIMNSATRCYSGGSDASHPSTVTTFQNNICYNNGQGVKLGSYAEGSSVVANVLSDKTPPESSVGDTVAHGNLVGVDPQLDSQYKPVIGSPVCGAGQPIVGVSGRLSTIGAYPCGDVSPPQPPSPLTLLCSGELGAEGKITMQCEKKP